MTEIYTYLRSVYIQRAYENITAARALHIAYNASAALSHYICFIIYAL